MQFQVLKTYKGHNFQAIPDAKVLLKSFLQTFFVYFFGGLECVGYFFAYVAH
jgi:hypothetical protein